MATPKKSAPKVVKKPEPKYVTEDRFSALESSVNTLVDILTAEKTAEKKQAAGVVPITPALQPFAPTVTLEEPPLKPAETDRERKIRLAGPQALPVNPEWDELARSILGEALDHCELHQLRSGGMLFTLVINREYSNATEDHLNFYKADRRTKDVSEHGYEDVEAWCKLVKQNLARPRY